MAGLLMPKGVIPIWFSTAFPLLFLCLFAHRPFDGIIRNVEKIRILSPDLLTRVIEAESMFRIFLVSPNHQRIRAGRKSVPSVALTREDDERLWRGWNQKCVLRKESQHTPCPSFSTLSFGRATVDESGNGWLGLTMYFWHLARRSNIIHVLELFSKQTFEFEGFFFLHDGLFLNWDPFQKMPIMNNISGLETQIRN
ncbi:predicted protein [Sclerotinia sclerotiorum 1980 UF-70]|uniref:Uncharacterized protein n=1 Tax=Sclerotinia sclerotiorum (strain ATCC 18683 / 1980 / Ss-1) TaxID=665079 RepID=A7F4P9_SCLS1|nr:predicted protein [Sclerotinia sclerotiorum 1980 UF-70]EDN97720.1 predicted protein [Sclerotinia sclerotiorum 1980 UF-70]